VDTPRPCPRQTMGFEEVQVEGKISQHYFCPADNVTTTSLSDSESERHACIAQADVPQSMGSQSKKSYLKEYERITDET